MPSKVLCLTAALSLAATGARADEVHVYNWSDYIDSELLQKFQDETGIKVVYDVFDSNEILETKLLAGGSGYDVVVPSDSFLRRQILAGAFQELDPAKLPNAGNQWDLITDRTADFDPGNAYSVNYLWGTTGVGINVAKVTEALGTDAPVESLALVFDPANMEKLSACGVYFLDAPVEMIPAAMNYAGLDPNSKDKAAFDAAEEVLAAVRPYVRKFHSSEYITALANGEICVAVGWSGDILQARDRADEADNGVEIAYHAFREGSAMWFDQMAIPADAPNSDAAHAFVNFMLDPENIAAVSNYVYYANGNLPAQEFLEAEVIGDPAIYPDSETLESLWVFNGWDPKTLRLGTRLWTKIKSGI
ncbi:polyamine ABC transporter substrate-binding protein [Tropicimonas sediminicola]|uniref:Putrescine-binding periplasmic protein n=1 Tax=Tropicimonas sediminicola TaxID=1031541 RepID=A0A239M6U6_9RHOB|nr:polyamine ABC transporter substrate-binding protein [Tropicimonas sediminicola]SNT38436.1 putrescine transport system substrate-binding protein [Tropicimonas sediminicola]